MIKHDVAVNDTMNLKNVIILGSGRSGTSMVAGTLFGKGFYMGSHLYPEEIYNPKGYFESWEINSINEDLLAQVVLPRPPFLGKWFLRNRSLVEQRWLARIPVEAVIPRSNEIANLSQLRKEQWRAWFIYVNIKYYFVPVAPRHKALAGHPPQNFADEVPSLRA